MGVRRAPATAPTWLVAGGGPLLGRRSVAGEGGHASERAPNHIISRAGGPPAALACAAREEWTMGAVIANLCIRLSCRWLKSAGTGGGEAQCLRACTATNVAGGRPGRRHKAPPVAAQVGQPPSGGWGRPPLSRWSQERARPLAECANGSTGGTRQAHSAGQLWKWSLRWPLLQAAASAKCCSEWSRVRRPRISARPRAEGASGWPAPPSNCLCMHHRAARRGVTG